MRNIKDDEKPLISYLFHAVGLETSDYLRVTPEDEEEKGTLLFQPGSSITQFGIAKCYFIDVDGITVVATLNATSEGKPAELEIKKTDNSPIQRWPSETDILDKPPNN